MAPNHSNTFSNPKVPHNEINISFVQIFEKTLKILFATKDLTKVKTYVQVSTLTLSLYSPLNITPYATTLSLYSPLNITPYALTLSLYSPLNITPYATTLSLYSLLNITPYTP